MTEKGNMPAQAGANEPKTLQGVMNSPAMVRKLNGILGNEKTAKAFISSVISVGNGNPALRRADPMSVIGAAMVAATLNLPIVPTLGMAYIVPYKGQAQFQIGYKGLIELAQRSGEFRTIIDEVVYEGELISKNRFTGEFVFDETARLSDKVIGYMARYDLINGFSKTIYWTKEEVEAHARQYSQSFRGQFQSPWKTNFDQMARKTVLKSLFSKYAPKSTEINMAVQADQATVRLKKPLEEIEDVTIDSFVMEYDDNPEVHAETVAEDVDPSKDLFGERKGKGK